MPPLEIRLLGGFHMKLAGEALALPARVQALLAYVILQGEGGCSRQQLAFTFWPESTDKQARTNLRRLLLLLRRGLPQVDEFLDITSQRLVWRSIASVRLDLATFQNALEDATEDPFQRRAALDKALTAYGGDLLPDCYDEWILPERERLRNAYAQALDDLTLLAENERDYTGAMAHARRLLRHDPLHEATYRHLMRLLALTGDRAGALRVYHTCATLLRREVGVDPGPETRQAYERLLGQEAAPAAPVVDGPAGGRVGLVGRQTEWRTLQENWRRASRGAPHWVLISGEAGMGKSRLAEEMLAWAERQAIPAAHARSYASSWGASYGPIIDLLRTDSLRQGWQKLDDLWLVELSRLLPEIHADRPDLSRPPALAEEWQKRRLFEALALACLDDDRPRLLVLDDLHWTDRESLEFLAFLLRYRSHARLLLVCTARSVEMLDNKALQIVLREAAVQGQLTQLPLASLTVEETGQLAAQTGGVSLDGPAIQRLHGDSGGNPLFVVEMVRAGGGISRDSRFGMPVPSAQPISDLQSPIPSLPPKIQAVIESHLGQLSPGATEIVAQAAVLGRSFTYPVLAGATTLDEAALVDGLDELWRRRIIREVGGEGYDFSHDRIRDVAYGVISQARRRLLHRRAGEALLGVHAGTLEAVQGQLGYHFAAAGEALAAIEHYRLAAAVAMERYAHAEAAGYLSAAMALAEREGDAAIYPLLAERERINRLARRMEAWEEDLAQLEPLVSRLNDGSREAQLRQGQMALALHYYAFWVGHKGDSAGHAADAVRFARAVDHPPFTAEALIRLGYDRWEGGRFDEAWMLLDEAYQTALQAALPAVAARCLETQMQLLMFHGGNAARIMEGLSRCTELYMEAEDESGKVRTLNKLLYVPIAQGEGDYREALAYFEQALPITQRIGDYHSEMNLERNAGLLYTCQGDAILAGEHLDRATALSVERKEEWTRPLVENYRGFWLFQQGRLSEAKVRQMHAASQLRERQNNLWMVKAITALGWIAFYGGDWQQAEARATEAIAECESFSEERQIAHSCTLRGWARLKQGRADAALPDFRRSLEILQRLEMVNRAQEPVAGLAQAACLRGDMEAARAQALPIARHLLSHPLDRTTDTFLAIHTVHAILAAVRDPLAGDVRGLAQAHLEHRAAHMDPAHLDAFWAMPGHREMVETLRWRRCPRA